MTRVTDAQLTSLRWLELVGHSGRMPHYQSRGLPSLLSRCLVENVGGRGRNAKLVLNAAGRDLIAELKREGRWQP